MDFVPMAAPAAAVIGSAVWITLREMRGRDVMIDLTDEEVPEVRLAVTPARTQRVPPRSGNLVSAPRASLGARLQHTQPIRPAQRSVQPHRRTRPLVADRS